MPDPTSNISVTTNAVDGTLTVRLPGARTQTERDEAGVDRRPYRRDDTDPAAVGAIGLPHEQTFASIWFSLQKIYKSWFDEAQRTSLEDALTMRRDPFVYALLRRRQEQVAYLPYQIKVDDEEDPDQARFVERLSKLIDATPRYSDYKMALQEAIWFGKAGANQRLDRKAIDGRPRVVIASHEPISGDKIVWQWGGTPAVMVRPTWRPDDGRVVDGDLIRTDRGQAVSLHRAYWRDQFAVHTFEPTDVDYLFEADQAGAVYGLGLRHRIYFAWWLRAEFMSYMVNALQRLSANGQMVGYYDEGNSKQRDRVIEAMKVLSDHNVTAFPRDPSNPNAPLFDRFEVGDTAYQVFMQVIQWLEDIIRQAIVGQELTTGTAPTGLGSGVAQAHEDTFQRIVAYDSANLGETLTRDLCGPLVRYNTWTWRGKEIPGTQLPFGFKLELSNPKADLAEKCQAASTLQSLNIPFDGEGLRDDLGFQAPKATDQTGAAQAPQAPGGLGGSGQPGQPAPGGNGQPGGNGAPDGNGAANGIAAKPAAPAQPPRLPPAPRPTTAERLRMTDRPEVDRATYAADHTTAADPGVMIALALPADAADALAADAAHVPGAEPAADLHVTLAYLGRRSTLTKAKLRAAERTVKLLCMGHRPFTGSLGGLGRFSASATSDGQDVLYASVDVPGLAEFRTALVEALEDQGIDVAGDHGFTPHVTLAYVDPDADMPMHRLESRPITFKHVCLAVGAKWHRYPFGMHSRRMRDRYAASNAGRAGDGADGSVRSHYGFDPNEPRDDSGKWTATGASALTHAMPTADPGGSTDHDDHDGPADLDPEDIRGVTRRDVDARVDPASRRPAHRVGPAEAAAREAAGALLADATLYSEDGGKTWVPVSADRLADYFDFRGDFDDADAIAPDRWIDRALASIPDDPGIHLFSCNVGSGDKEYLIYAYSYYRVPRAPIYRAVTRDELAAGLVREVADEAGISARTGHKAGTGWGSLGIPRIEDWSNQFAPLDKARYASAGTWDESKVRRGDAVNAGHFARKTAEFARATAHHAAQVAGHAGRVATHAGHLAHAPVAAAGRAVDRLPPRLRRPVKRIKRIYFATYDAAQAAALDAARAAGLPEDHVKLAGNILAAADLAGMKLTVVGAHALGLGPVGTFASGLVPVASLSYLAYSTARRPVATLNAARRAIKAVLGGIVEPEAPAIEKVRHADAADRKSIPTVNVLLVHRLGKVHDDWYVALLHAALDATQGDLGRAMKAADAAYSDGGHDGPGPDDGPGVEPDAAADGLPPATPPA